MDKSNVEKRIFLEIKNKEPSLNKELKYLLFFVSQLERFVGIALF